MRTTVRANQCGNSSVILKNWKSLEVFSAQPLSPSIVQRWAWKGLWLHPVLSQRASDHPVCNQQLLLTLLNNSAWSLLENRRREHFLIHFVVLIPKPDKDQFPSLAVIPPHAFRGWHSGSWFLFLSQLQPTPPGSEHPDAEQQVSTRRDPLHPRWVFWTWWDSGLGQLGFSSQADTDSSVTVR